MIVLFHAELNALGYPKGMEVFSKLDDHLRNMEHFRVGQFSFLIKLQANELRLLGNFCKRSNLQFFVLEVPDRVQSTWAAHPDVNEWLRGKGVLVEPVEC